MKKIGPLTVDLVVACMIFELQLEGIMGIEFTRLVSELDGIVGKSTILNALNTLSDWGVVKTEFGETEAGRAGRLYHVSGEAEGMIKQTYETFWERVKDEVGM